MTKARLKELTDKFQKADAFYASNAPAEKKDKFLPALHSLVDELGALYCKLLREGKATPEDLTSYSYSTERVIFGGKEYKFDGEKFVFDPGKYAEAITNRKGG